MLPFQCIIDLKFIRDWWGATKREGGACEVLPLQTLGGGGTNSFSHAETGGTKVLSIDFVTYLD